MLLTGKKLNGEYLLPLTLMYFLLSLWSAQIEFCHQGMLLAEMYLVLVLVYVYNLYLYEWLFVFILGLSTYM